MKTAADYVDGGGGVVLGLFSFGTLPGGCAGGRWVNEGYNPLIAKNTAQVEHQDHPQVKPFNDHFLFSGIQEFNGGRMFSYHQLTLHPSAELMAEWANGNPLVAYRQCKEGRVVSLNFWPVSSTTNPSLWSKGGDFLITNSLLYVANLSRSCSSCFE
eukprot:TRINITY_DN8365_c0_g1_i1.p1 TRINITY_DN8365_c0_g1~~TRINITY_DN8365_c0_g1_i1.p1  ORF type:complete len:157 (-),score=40.02 TRINITY_DN8365_c0_g1_i1:17-487(-)